MKKYVLSMVLWLVFLFTYYTFAADPIINQSVRPPIWAIVGHLAAITAAAAAIISAIVALRSQRVASEANDRARKLFEFQNPPAVQVKPLRFFRAPNIPDAGVTILEINNHSIADAYEVEWDLRYSGGRSWIKAWIKTEIQRLEKIQNRAKQEEVKLRHYKSMDIFPISALKASEFKLANISGVVPSDLCDQATPENKYPVQVKTTWRSEKGQRFSTEIEYGLVCTKVGDLEEYDFIGGEVLSQGV